MNVLVLLPLTEAQRVTLEAGAPDATYTYATHVGVTDEQVAAADVIVGNLAPSRLGIARNLRLLQLNSAGYDKYVAPGIVPAGAALTCAVGAYGQAVSEHMFAMILAMMKHLDGYRDDERSHLWTDRGQVTTFVERRCSCLGAGDIGSHFAQLASAFGAHVTGVRRHVGEVPAGLDAMRTMDALPDLLPTVDVGGCLPAQHGCDARAANAEFFASCKPAHTSPTAAAETSVVAGPDLIAALESGQLAGAALDVTTPEPLPADDPLWDRAEHFHHPARRRTVPPPHGPHQHRHDHGGEPGAP